MVGVRVVNVRHRYWGKIEYLGQCIFQNSAFSLSLVLSKTVKFVPRDAKTIPEQYKLYYSLRISARVLSHLSTKRPKVLK